MDSALTHYEVLQPTSIDNLYEVMGTFAYETSLYQTKTPEFIKKKLTAVGMYSTNIIVRHVG